MGCGGGALGEFAVGEELGGAAQIVFEGDGRVALTVAGESATLGIAEQLLAAGGGRVGARGLADLDQFDVLGCDGVAGANAATLTLATVVVAAVVAGERKLGERVGRVAAHAVAESGRQGWGGRVIRSWREGAVRRGVEIEVGSGFGGFEERGLPFVGMTEIGGGHAENGEDEVDGVAVDDVEGDGLGELGEGGLDLVEGVEGRQEEGEALAAGAGLGGAQTVGAMLQMVETETLAGDSERLAGAAGVVDVMASVRHECLQNDGEKEKGPCRMTRGLASILGVIVQGKQGKSEIK